METEYSSEAIAAAMSLQTYTVRRFLVDTGIIDNHLLPVHIRCVLSEPLFFVLTQLSIHGYVLGAFISLCFHPLLNMLVIQTYDYTCSLNDEVTHPFTSFSLSLSLFAFVILTAIQS
jgi:hypothetical protein